MIAAIAVIVCTAGAALGPLATILVGAVKGLLMGRFDMLSFGISLLDKNNPIVLFNQKLHLSAIYITFQIGVSALAVFSAGAASTMKCFVAGTLVL